MLVVTLVATLASAALWQQWRSAAVEAAERQRVQASWILTGALDWARLILREDARSNRNSGNADHLGEPWATPLEEAQLSSFLAADQDNNADDLMPAYLSGEMVDAQSRLNVMNLVMTSGKGTETKMEVSEPDLAAFTKLYQLLDLPAAELTAAVESLLETSQLALVDPKPSSTPIVAHALRPAALAGVQRRQPEGPGAPCGGLARTHPAQPQHGQCRGHERQHPPDRPCHGPATGDRARQQPVQRPA